jgi:hypothetical protein
MSQYHLRGAARALAIAAFASAALGATAAFAHDGHIYKGPVVKLGKGTAYAWVQMGKGQTPKAVGATFTDAALADIEELLHEESLVLPFPRQVAGTPFDHVYLNWNPNGHPPEHVWGKPHFDVHFYMMSPADRDAIAESDPAYMAKFAKDPAAELLPAGYVKAPEPVPAMGAHWVDPATPEFNGKDFTYTLIYGAWNGKVTFIEPMITRAVFDARKPIIASVKQSSAVEVSGLYPTQYRIEFDAAAGEHRVILENMVAREGAHARIGRQARQ